MSTKSRTAPILRSNPPPGHNLKVIKFDHAKRGFVLWPRRWVVERSFDWAARFRRFARDYESLARSLAARHWLAFVCLMLRNFLSAVYDSL